MKKTFLFFLLYFLVFTSEAFAYFDPGTGAFIIQAILGFLAAVVASLTMTWSRVKMFFIKIFQKKSKSEKKENK
tara:strand:- start:491 stop:712 length:222 start_codon:yes stop_codon:yes gene_type:complete